MYFGEKGMSELISVIVPVYNVGKYLKPCLNSIENQTYENMEIILVDDGSTDESGKICDFYAMKDIRIKVIHKGNGGLSDARNTGIRNANGEYLVFVDGDDIISCNAVELLYELVSDRKAQIGICDIVHCLSEKDTHFKSESRRKTFTPQDAICELLYQKSFLVSACGKIFKYNCFNNLEFPVGLLFEDSAIMYKIFENASMIKYSNAEVYGYLHREGSITTGKFSKRDCDIQVICNQIVEDLSTKSGQLKKAAICYQVVGALRIYLNAPRDGFFDEEIQIASLLIRKNGFKVLFDTRSRRKTRIAIMLFFAAKPLMPLIYKRINRWRQ